MVPGPDSYWHAVPLPYLPHLLATGSLFSSAELQRQGLPIVPRPTALRRRRQLGLADCIHFSLRPDTPLLTDKCAKGYPHALMAFSPTLVQLPGAAFLKWNTKRWAHRDEFVPVTDHAAFLTAWAAGAYPSAELLIPKVVPLALAERIELVSPEAAAWLPRLAAACGVATLPITIAPERFPGLAQELSPTLTAYFEDCAATGTILAPPVLPFD